MFIKRAKSRPSLRARNSEDGPDSSPLAQSSFTADVYVDDAEEGGSILERKKAQKKEKRKDGLGKSTRLSFGGDEDGGDATAFKPRRSLLSQSFKLPSTPAASSVSKTPSTSSSVYSREYLSELKASTPSRAPRITTVKDDSDEEEMNVTGLSRLARDKYAATLMEDTTAGIPDEVAIVNAKTKRQAAVENVKHGGNLGEDYIALGAGQVAVFDASEEPHPESRLMREEDEGEEGDEGESILLVASKRVENIAQTWQTTLKLMIGCILANRLIGPLRGGEKERLES